jgi:hypothetical protein
MRVWTHCWHPGVYRFLWPHGDPGAIHVVESGAAHHVTRGSRVGATFSCCSKGYPCSRVPIGYNCLFTDVGVTVFRRSDDSIAFKGVLEGQLYLVDFNRSQLDTYLIAKTNTGWLWHHRLALVGMKNLHKLLKGEHILGLTNVHFEKDRVYSACQAGKQVGAHHPHKNIMTTDRSLELLHMDLFGPIAYISIGRSKYCLVIVDDYSRFTWVFFLQDKSQTQEALKGFLR